MNQEIEEALKVLERNGVKLSPLDTDIFVCEKVHNHGNSKATKYCVRTTIPEDKTLIRRYTRINILSVPWTEV